MTTQGYVFLAEGFEEIEAVTPIDLLRRAGLKVKTVGVSGKIVTGSHGMAMMADEELVNFTWPQGAQLLVLPGGMPGTTNLLKNQKVFLALRQAVQAGAFVGAICAAPLVLQEAGLLAGRRFTAFPGKLAGATGAAVETDGYLITARSAGVALEFSKALIKVLFGQEKAEETVGMLYPE